MKDNTNELGVTLHEMDESFDTGNIIFQSMMTRVKEQSLFINNCRLFEVGATLAIKFMKNEESMIHIPEKKNQVHSYDSWPTNNDVNNFKKTGGKLITPRDLWDQI